MKIKKKLLAVLAVCIMLISLTAVMAVSTAAEDGGFEVTMVTSGDVKAGEQVKIEVYFTGSNITSLVFIPEYDEDILAPKSGVWVIDPSLKGKLCSDWDIANGFPPLLHLVQTASFTNEKVLEFTFEVSATAFDPGDSTLISLSEIAVEVQDPDTNTLTTFNTTQSPDMFEIEDSTLHAYCEHTSTQNIAKQEPTCYQVGYEAGVQCTACLRFMSGHDEIPATGEHSYTVWDKDTTHHWKKCATTGCVAIDDTTKATHTYDNECDADCNGGCGYTRTVEHAFTAWDKDDTYHWKKCFKTGCTAKDDTTKATHTYDNECDVDCNDGCGYTRTIEHSFTAWDKDDTNHWKVCSKTGCTAKDDTTKATHTYDIECDADCNDGCGYTRTIEHSFTAWDKDDTYHWKKCSKTGCTAKDDTTKATHTYDIECDADCNDGCGYTRTIEHAFTAWDKDDTYHWKVCSKDGCIAKDDTTKAMHTYDNECDADCNGDCGYTRTPPHKFEAWGTDATHHWKKCANDSCSVTDETTKVEHTYDNECDATCNGDCGYTRTPPHKFEAWGTDATYHWKKCANEGCSVTDETTKAEHTYDNECDATCNDDCGYTRTPPHKFEAWGTDATHHWKKCANDGCSVTDETTKVEHTYDNECDATCNGDCGYTRTPPHKFETWANDDTNHWKKCSNQGCEAIDETTVVAHSYASVCVAECKESCGYSRTEIPHDFATTWSKDEINHWYDCAGCDAQKDEAAHDKQSECDEACDICGQEFVTNGDHTFETTLTKGDTTHWYQCENCSAKDQETEHSYEVGICDPDCNDCGYVRTNPHSYKTEWSMDKEKHWHECSVCGDKIDEAEHIPGPAATTSSPQLCTICDYIIANKLPRPTYDTHNHSLTLVPAKEATCTADGNTAYYTCSGCDYWYANANATGKITNKDSVVIKSTGHEETVSAAVAATCTTDGKIEGKSCSKCGEVFVAQETVSATGHTFGEWQVVKEATGEADGEKARECSVCGEKETEIIPAIGVTDEPDETETPDDTEKPDEPSVSEDPKDVELNTGVMIGVSSAVVIIAGFGITVVFLKKKR